MFYTGAILLGLVSSLHCLGMCGPLLSMFPWYKADKFNIQSPLLHHGGRILAYAIIGVIGGIIGKSFVFIGMQQWLSVIAGLSILLILLFKSKLNSSLGFILKPIQKIHSVKSIQVSTKQFLLGVLNGFLPCGMVYIALGASISGGSIEKSIAYMVFFGLGTLPALLGFSLIQNWIGNKWRLSFKKVSNGILVLMALIFLMRGMNLGIPYLSPKFDTQSEQIKCH